MSDSFNKDPDATLDFGCDWAEWLSDGETLVGSTWDVPAGLTSTNADYSATLAVVWLSGGAAGSTYRVVNHVTTSAGRVDERSIFVHVEER